MPDLRRLLVGAFTVVFLGVQLWPGGVETGVSDKWGHFGGYLVLSLLVGWASTKRPVWWVLGVGFTMGCLTEGLQALVPGRTPDVQDLAVDWVAAIFAAFWFIVWVGQDPLGGETNTAEDRPRSAPGTSP